MTRRDLRQHNGCTIEYLVDNRPAIGIIFFATEEDVVVTSLCFANYHGDCPLVSHRVTDEEIASLSPKSRFRLLSGISVNSIQESLRAAA